MSYIAHEKTIVICLKNRYDGFDFIRRFAMDDVG